MTGIELIHAVLSSVSEEEGVFHTNQQVLTHLASAELFIGIARALGEKTDPFPLTANTPLYIVHHILPNFIYPLRATLNGKQLFPISLGHLSAVDPSWRLTTGTPRRYFVIGSTLLGFYPVSSTDQSIELTYVSVPPLLGPSDEPRIGREWSEALVRFSAAVLLCKEGKIQEATGELDGFMSAASLDKDPRFSAGESQGEASRPAIQPSYQPPRG